MSSPWLPDAEYAAIKASWRAAPRREPAFTNRVAVEMCHLNVKAAALQEAELRALYEELPVGDTRLNGDIHTSPLELRIRMACEEQRHWRETGAHYRGQGEREGWDTVVPVIGTSQARPAPRQLKSVPQEPDRRLPREREVGEDDLPF